MNLVVGNRVIYEYDGEVLDEIITDKQKLKWFQANDFKYKIKKVYACNWEEIEFVEE